MRNISKKFFWLEVFILNFGGTWRFWSFILIKCIWGLINYLWSFVLRKVLSRFCNFSSNSYFWYWHLRQVFNPTIFRKYLKLNLKCDLVLLQCTETKIFFQETNRKSNNQFSTLIGFKNLWQLNQNAGNKKN